MPAPNAHERKRCHEARDKYFSCKEVHDNDETACAKEKAGYVEACPAAWVKYFARKQVYDKYKEKIQSAGFKPSDET